MRRVFVHLTAEEQASMQRNIKRLFPAGLVQGAGVPSGPRANTFIECGCCGAFHRTDFRGDCRENSERFADIPEGGEEVFEDEVTS